jgi:hypothetical protein
LTAANVTFHDQDWEKTTVPGAEVYFGFDCPTHKGRRCDLLLIRDRSGSSRPSWNWNGDREVPTFQPSINHKGCWHGYIINGRCVKTDQKTDEPEPVS